MGGTWYTMLFFDLLLKRLEAGQISDRKPEFTFLVSSCLTVSRFNFASFFPLKHFSAILLYQSPNSDSLLPFVT